MATSARTVCPANIFPARISSEAASATKTSKDRWTRCSAAGSDAISAAGAPGAPHLGVQNLLIAARVAAWMPTESRPKSARSTVPRWPEQRRRGCKLAPIKRTVMLPLRAS